MGRAIQAHDDAIQAALAANRAALDLVQRLSGHDPPR
jgi:selenocysteine-specific translation elongation factor